MERIEKFLLGCVILGCLSSYAPLSMASQRGSQVRGGSDSILMPDLGNQEVASDSALEDALAKPLSEGLRNNPFFLAHQREDAKPATENSGSFTDTSSSATSSPPSSSQNSPVARRKKMDQLLGFEDELESLEKSKAPTFQGFLEAAPGRSAAFDLLTTSEDGNIDFDKAHRFKKLETIFEKCAPDSAHPTEVRYREENGITQPGLSSLISERFKYAKDNIRSVIRLPEHLSTLIQSLGGRKPCDPPLQAQIDARYKKTPALSLLDDMLIEKARKLKTPQQVACLALCASANAFTYNAGLEIVSSPFKGAEKTVQSDTGVCWDHTRIANHFLKVLTADRKATQQKDDLFFRTRSNIPHSFLEVRFQKTGPWFGADPMAGADPWESVKNPGVAEGVCSLRVYGKSDPNEPKLGVIDRVRKKLGKPPRGENP